MVSTNNWVGVWVRISCAELGAFEGKVSTVMDDLLVLKDAVFEGKAVHSNEVKIKASDITNLEIIQDPSSLHSKTEALAASPARPEKKKKSGEKSATPKKQERQKPFKTKDKECFGQAVEEIVVANDFDFEKNLALFDKKAVFEEMESSGVVTGVRKGFRESNIKPDESVLQQQVATSRKIIVPEDQKGREYSTEIGITVPAISPELRMRLIQTSEQMGLTAEQRIEAAGLCAWQMTVQLLGGPQRFTRSNAHQTPSVVVMAGPHIQGLQGICTARHLANRNVQVTLFIPRKTQDLIPQLALYMHTGGALAASVRDLPRQPVDLVIDALAGHNQKKEVMEQTLNAVEWANQNMAPILSLDPCLQTSSLGLEVKWSLALGLPLANTPKSGRLYLGDIGIPKGVFSAVDINYISPFGDKFVIPLET
ncbi:enhancer of mRNA-decapping protein 3 isoform X2 [Nematostella vectensis]|uniref:enhancer of mRNA-decapping protein 3 isoform X2 n=1 Tax=Nematostella vectensis TaxID=45351 RepID=UPI0013903FBF|nr:enhancer of mRNA-decapping protein 3 isoform X2 [Nematostella vectensis]